MNSFIPTLEILAKLKTFLTAIPLADETPSVKLFNKVEFYSMPNLIAALEDLRIFKKRVCLIIPSADDFETENQGASIRTSATYEFELLIADRDYGRRQSASTGDSDSPGVVKMKDIVIEKLFGQNLDFKPRLLRLRPSSGQALLLTEKDRDNASGREAWQMTWHADAGDRIANVR